MPNKPAVALDAMPPAEELLAAKAAGLTWLQWKAKQLPAPVLHGLAIGSPPVHELSPARAIALSLPWSALHTNNRFFSIASKEYQGAKRRAQQQIGEQLPAGWLPLNCRLAVDVMLVVPDHRPRDLDNYRKLLLDSMKGLVYRDDSLIDDDRMRRQIDCDRPRAEITVTPLTDSRQ